MKKIFVLLLALFTVSFVFAQQPQFSLATDVAFLRSFKKNQRYWSIGQTVNFHFHFTPTDGAYALVSYFSNGNFSNSLTAIAKQPATIPQQINYQNDAQVRLKHISLGWKKYLKGTFHEEKTFALYGYAGFGLMLGNVVNNQAIALDSSIYSVPVLAGKANFKRLTLDVGLGSDFPVGADVYVYFEGRALIPTTDYPSPYLFVNSNAPFTATVNFGIRILFD